MSETLYKWHEMTIIRCYEVNEIWAAPEGKYEIRVDPVAVLGESKLWTFIDKWRVSNSDFVLNFDTSKEH